MSYSPTRIFKRYFSTPELRAVNLNRYVMLVKAGHFWPMASMITSVRYIDSDTSHTFPPSIHYATLRYLEQDFPELFI